MEPDSAFQSSRDGDFSKRQDTTARDPAAAWTGGDALFRYAVKTDLPRIVEIYNTTIASRQVTADLEPVSVLSRQAWFDAHDTVRRPLWVVLENDRPAAPIIGWLSLSDFYGRAAYNATAEISIYLAQEARGRGLGRACLAFALAAAPGLGVQTVLGFIFGHNEPSRALFHAAGFADWGHLPAVAALDGVERDLIIVGRRL